MSQILDITTEKRKASTRKFCSHYSLTIVVAVLNERDNLTSFCHSIDRLFSDYGMTCEVVVVNDGSSDGSRPLLEELSHQFSFLKILDHAYPKGLTHVLKTATQNIESDWIYLTAADLESDIYTDLPHLISAHIPGDTAIAGWRQDRGDHKKFASAIANGFCRIGFGLNIHDMNWVKLVRTEAICTLPLELVTHRYILAVLSGLGGHIREVPVQWHARQAGRSKFGRRRLWSSAVEFTKLWFWFQFRGRWLLPNITVLSSPL